MTAAPEPRAASPGGSRRGGRLLIGQRLFLGLAPALLAVALVLGLAYYGEYGREAPAVIVVGAGVLAVASLALTWLNARAIARRLARLAGPAPVTAARRGGDAAGEDELDRIEATVDRLGSALSASEAERARESAQAAVRLREEAALLAAATAAAIGRLDDLRLPLHILLENRFGELNENQVELLADARAAAELMDAELRRLRTVADADRGALAVTRELVQLNDVVRGVLPGAAAVARRRRARVDAELEPLLPRVHADRARLHEAMALLLADAVGHAGGGTVTVATARVGSTVVVAVTAPGSPGPAAPDATGADRSGPARASPRPPSPELVLATRLLEAQGSAVRSHGGRTEVAFAC